CRGRFSHAIELLRMPALVPVKVFMPSQLNGKRAPGRSIESTTRHQPRCPRNGTADDDVAATTSSASALTPLKARAFGKVAGVAPSARIPASKRAGPRARPMSHATAGKGLLPPD